LPEKRAKTLKTFVFSSLLNEYFFRILEKVKKAAVGVRLPVVANCFTTTRLEPANAQKLN
jgi:hypothetical protein